MGTYWGADGKTVDGRFEIVAGSVADAQTLWTPGMLYNETTSDKPRGNTQAPLLASAARTATLATATQTNYNARGIMLYLNITAASGTGGLIIRIIAQDAIISAGSQINVNAAAITTAGLKTHTLYPGASAIGAEVIQVTSTILPRNWFVIVQHGDVTSYTYSLDYALIL